MLGLMVTTNEALVYQLWLKNDIDPIIRPLICRAVVVQPVAFGKWMYAQLQSSPAAAAANQDGNNTDNTYPSKHTLISQAEYLKAQVDPVIRKLLSHMCKHATKRGRRRQTSNKQMLLSSLEISNNLEANQSAVATATDTQGEDAEAADPFAVSLSASATISEYVPTPRTNVRAQKQVTNATKPQMMRRSSIDQVSIGASKVAALAATLCAKSSFDRGDFPFRKSDYNHAVQEPNWQLVIQTACLHLVESEQTEKQEALCQHLVGEFVDNTVADLRKLFSKSSLLNPYHISKTTLLLISVRGIRTLNLSNCSLPQVPDCISLLSSLEELRMSNNTFETLPDGMEHLVNLKILDCSRCPLKCFPVKTLSITGLRELSIGRSTQMDHDAIAAITQNFVHHIWIHLKGLLKNLYC